MLESKNDNKDRDDIDISENTSGTVGFDPKTGKVFYVDEPKKKESPKEFVDDVAKELAKDMAENNKAILDLLKEAGIDDIDKIKDL